MGTESLTTVIDEAQASTVHNLTAGYMKDLETGILNSLFVGEDLACQVATEAISQEVAEEVMDNLGISTVIDD